jgi:hypothetical protein
MLDQKRLSPQRRHSIASAEHISWGKVVTSAGGAVAYWSPCGVTSLSSGLSTFDIDALGPEALLGVPKITREMIVAPRPGALFARHLVLTSRSGAPWPVFVVLRMRFRPEAGERSSGRVYLQARALLIGRESWARIGTLCVARALGAFRADPDVLKNSTDFDFNAAPATLDIHGGAALEQRPASEQMLRFLTMSGPGDVLELGDESVDSEADFLSALAWAMDRARAVPAAGMEFGFSTGCLARGTERWIHHVSGRRCEIERSMPDGQSISSELLEWQRLLVDAALSSRSLPAALLLDKTEKLCRSLAGVVPAQREEIEQLLPNRERALLRHFAVAAGWDDPTRLTDDVRKYSTDAVGLIAKFAVCSVWSEVKSNIHRLTDI